MLAEGQTTTKTNKEDTLVMVIHQESDHSGKGRGSVGRVTRGVM